MTSNQYKYFSQKKFHGGIETRQEFIEDNQLLDARNHWAPLGEMEQRPGTRALRYTTLAGAAASYTETRSMLTTAAGVSTILTPASSNLDAAVFGDSFDIHFSSLANPNCLNINVSLNGSGSATNLITKTRVQLFVGTATGWEPVAQYAFGGTITLGNGFGLYFVPPTGFVSTTKTFTTGTYTGYFFRLKILSATTTTGAPFTPGVVWGSGVSATAVSVNSTVTKPALAVNTNAVYISPGTALLKYNKGNLVASTFVTPAVTTPTAPVLTIAVSHAINEVTTGGATFTDQKYAGPNVPPAFTVIPEWNTAYIAYANTVFEVPYDVGTASVATVNTDPLIVGPISVENPAVPYSTDLIPQLTTFPAANLIVYFRNQLFCSGIEGSGNLIRWSGSSTDAGYNVWPEDNQVTLSTAKDNSEITAIAPLGDNLVVFKKNSIWQLIDNGISDVNLPLYEPRLVVAGVGTVAHQSVQAVDGGLIFLGEDGFYRYDGTPNIKRISDPIQPHMDKINPARSPFAVATVWRSKQAYMCAVSLDSETQANDFVFVYAYDNNAWWAWDGWDAQCWFQIDGVGLQEEVYFLDNAGAAFKLGAWTQTDNGAEIDSWFLTPRFGFDDAITKTALELRVRGINNNPTVNFNVIGDDVEINVTGSATVDPLTLPITMAGVDEAQYANDETYGEAVYAPTRRRERKSANRTTASWFQIRIRRMLKVFGWDLGYEPEGRR